MAQIIECLPIKYEAPGFSPKYQNQKYKQKINGEQGLDRALHETLVSIPAWIPGSICPEPLQTFLS
jgi:hypothetical protein